MLYAKIVWRKKIRFPKRHEEKEGTKKEKTKKEEENPYQLDFP
jgi:hypothetical protein